MTLYLPVAEIPVNVPMILFFGATAGVLSGMFGVGGGFLLTPMLIFAGVPAPVAAASSANQIIGSSFSGVMTHWRKGHVDFHLGAVMIAGGMIGASGGVSVFRWLQKTGSLDITISLCYVFILGGVSLFMAQESLRTLLKSRKLTAPPSPLAGEEPRFRPGFPRLPFQIRFKRSDMQVSVLLPLALGAFAGVLVAITGIGGGFLLIPAMIYILGVPTNVTVGTSLFQILCITTFSTLLQATATRTIDLVLVMLLLAGSVTGARLGAALAGKFRPEPMRLALALLALATAGKLAYDLFATPASLYSVNLLP